MTQVLTRPVGIEIPDIPADLIEQEALTLLGIEVVDRQDYTHKCVPHGDLRWWVHRGETELQVLSQAGVNVFTLQYRHLTATVLCLRLRHRLSYAVRWR